METLETLKFSDGVFENITKQVNNGRSVVFDNGTGIIIYQRIVEKSSTLWAVLGVVIGLSILIILFVLDQYRRRKKAKDISKQDANKNK